ncbi:hypothetical protein [Salibaculum griseiflavum]|uniref:Uncharacterized protein n=1 Tax=Salibaculum griseiflavum TaxID=1914409 RepID=A0A2V1P306_9RHOB|nr:hypothetical protein [Salibaculum griseiflavum]PWG16148.1 hypothetical protein DFK10_13225 [Salibaculum griseiflavum]
MRSAIQTGPTILIGYAYHLRLEATVGSFPEGARLTGHVRATAAAEEILASLTSEAGELLRVSDYALDLHIPAAATARMRPGSVVLDVVRRDVEPDLHLGFALEIPVILPVTRGLA